MGRTSIEWTDAVYNPVTGCTKVSPGCKNCYAEKMAHRLKAMGQAKYANGFEVACHPTALNEPFRWKKSRRVFVCSMGDLFHKDVPDAFISEVFVTMRECPRHTFQVLTKRIDRAAEFLLIHKGARSLPNVWLMTSAEDQQRFDERVPVLVHNCPAVVRGVSLEPLLGPIDLGQAGRRLLDWVVVGCESGPGARPMDIDWVRLIRDQCVEFEIPMFFKQAMVDGHKVTMPELDGRVWDQFPGGV